MKQPCRINCTPWVRQLEGDFSGCSSKQERLFVNRLFNRFMLGTLVIPTAKQKGFTLIELMIVVAIIGVLAAVAIPFYNDYISKTKVSACSMSFAGFKTDATLSFTEGGSWPAAFAIDTTVVIPSELSEYADVIDGNYISKISYNPEPSPCYQCELIGFDATVLAWQWTGDVWECSSSKQSNDCKTTMENKYLPSLCKS